MSFDYSKLSDEDLEALSKDDYKSITTEGLQHIASYEEPKQASTETPYESNWERAGKEVGTAGVGIGQMAAEHPGIAAAIASSPIAVPYGMKLADKLGDVANGYTNAKNAHAVGELARQTRLAGGAVNPNTINSVLEQTASKVAPETVSNLASAGKNHLQDFLALDKHIAELKQGGHAVSQHAQDLLEHYKGLAQNGSAELRNTVSNTAKSVQELAAQKAAQMGPVLGEQMPMYRKALGVVNKIAAPAAIASELYYTSPEDRAALQEMERNHTTLKDWTKQKLGIGQPVAPGQQ